NENQLQKVFYDMMRARSASRVQGASARSARAPCRARAVRGALAPDSAARELGGLGAKPPNENQLQKVFYDMMRARSASRVQGASARSARAPCRARAVRGALAPDSAARELGGLGAKPPNYK